MDLPMDLPIALWLVEDEPRYSRPFARLIERAPDFVLARTFATYEEVLGLIGRAGRVGGGRAGGGRAPDGVETPDLVVMDLQLPGIGGIEATRDLRARLGDVTVVVLTNADDPDSIFGALRAGASGYLLKESPAQEVLASLREAHRGGTSFPPSVARHVLGFFAPEPAGEEPLSPREREVVEHLALGLSKAQIGDALCLSRHTVDSHLRNVYAKLHARSAAEAVAKAVRQGII